MKITDRKSIGRTAGPIATPRLGPAPKVDAAVRREVPEADEVVLSQSLHEVDRAKKALAALPDVRIDKVRDVKPRVADGSYQVDSRAVAKRMVDTAVPESARGQRKRRP